MAGGIEMDDALTRDMRRRDFLVKKDKVLCTIMTSTSLIEGELHKRGAFRVIDELNSADAFIAVTNATIRTSMSDEVLETDFLALRADEITWVRPLTS